MYIYLLLADPLSQVKIQDIGSWLGRRNFSFSAIRSAIGRAMWRYRFKYIAPKKANAAFIYHFMFVTFTLNYLIYEYPLRSLFQFFVPVTFWYFYDLYILVCFFFNRTPHLGSLPLKRSIWTINSQHIFLKIIK